MTTHTGLSTSPTAPRAESMSDRQLLPFLGALYTCQFLGAGFITVGLVGILRAEGIDLDTLGVVQLIGLIWPLKFLWAPLIDRMDLPGVSRHGRRRGWLLVAQSAMVVSIAALLMVSTPSASVPALLSLCGLFILFSATQDIAADSLAVRLTESGRRGHINGIQMAASYLGTALGGGLAVAVYDLWGWPWAILLLLLPIAGSLVLVVRFREPRGTTTAMVQTPGSAWNISALFGAVLREDARPWAFRSVPLLYSGAGGVYALMTPMLVDVGWSLSRIGLVTSVIASIPAVIVGLASGALVQSFGVRTVFGVSGAVLILGSALLWPVGSGSATGWWLATLAVSVYMAGYTVLNVGIYAVNMDLCRSDREGVDFTVLTSLGMACSFIAGWLILVVAGSAGYPIAIGVGIAILIAGIVSGLRTCARAQACCSARA